MKNHYYTIRMYPSLSEGDSRSFLLQYAATRLQATRVVEWYEKLWYEVIDKQLDHLDPDIGRVDIEDLTDDVILHNWEGCEILAFSRFDDTVLFYSDEDSWLVYGSQKRWVELEDSVWVPMGSVLRGEA